jgi:hypothetical protein
VLLGFAFAVVLELSQDDVLRRRDVKDDAVDDQLSPAREW